MIQWYRDDEIGIYFDKKLHIDVRYVTSDTDDKLKKDIKNKPFENQTDIDVILIDSVKGKFYQFNIPKGYTWDGASVPRLFWRLIGSKTDNRFLIPSMIHDVLCENHHYVNNDRYFADKVFERLLYVSDVNAFSRWMIFHSVDNFQKFCNWGKEK